MIKTRDIYLVYNLTAKDAAPLAVSGFGRSYAGLRRTGEPSTDTPVLGELSWERTCYEKRDTYYRIHPILTDLNIKECP
jgi:hypothetical protein